jgi:formate hydrogenlyase subunit 6/NADH:ubiquinone oxidoreductase subunit I
MRYPKLRELKEAIKALIKGPYTSKFPFKPHIPPEGYRGRPEFHKEDCIGCGACFQVCPSAAIQMQDKQKTRRLTVNWDMCNFCGQCQRSCPTEKGIILSKEFDLATTGKREELKQNIEKELVLCQACNEVIAPYEQIIWVSRRLGVLTFSNAGLMLIYLKNKLKFTLCEQRSATAEFLRSDRVKLLCPRCRREAVIKS